MKRFDKGYVYSALLSDLFSSIVVVFIFLKDLFLDDEATVEEMIAALPFLGVAVVVLYLCLIVYRILYYKNSGYALGETEIHCQRGVLFKKRSVLNYRKIHAINKRQNLLHRIFGIAILTVDSGSTNTAHQAEITIVEKAATVDALLEELHALKEGGVRSDEAHEEVLLSDKDSLYTFTSNRKLLYTLINIVSTAFFTAVLGALAVIILGVCKWLLRLDELGTWGEYFLAAFLLTVGAMLLFSIFSFIGCMIHSFIGYHDFSITKRGGDIQIAFGLLDRHTNTFRYDRIKAVKITQGLVQRMLGFATIKLEVIGYTESSGNEDSTALGVLVPFCKYEEIGEILGKVLPDYVPDVKQTKAVSYFPFISWFTLILGIVLVAVLLPALAVMWVCRAPAAAIVAVVLSVLGAGAVVLAVKAVSALLAYHTNGLAVQNGKITAYYGGFTKNVTVFMTRHLIAAETVTTPLRQKAGITSLVMHLKTNALSNEVKVHMQDTALSEELETRLTV